MKQLLVIIVAYNSMKWAERCYDSLRASTVPCDVLMVDNGSTDGTVAYVRSHYPEVQIVETGKNLGFGQANNIGMNKALQEGHEYVYLLNQDAWVLPDTFEKLIAVSKSCPEFGVLSPMQTQADGEHLDDKFATNAIGSHQRRKPYLIEDLYFGRTAKVYETTFVMAAHWLISRRCLQTVGGFSPTYPHYGEDNDYLNRCRYWKMKIGIVPAAKAVHDRADSQWSVAKDNYIHYYITCLVSASNPLGTYSLYHSVIDDLKVGLRCRNKEIFNYGLRLLRERKQVAINYKRSLLAGAFLDIVS